MKPGRELDALVAEHVMGWKLSADGSEWLDADEVYIEDAKYWRIGGNDDILPWSPSTDIAAAWQVDRPGWTWEFQETSHDLTATLYPSPEARSEALTSYPILPEGVVLVRREWLDDKAGTYAWVRCLAALRAMGVEVEDA